MEDDRPPARDPGTESWEGTTRSSLRRSENSSRDCEASRISRSPRRGLPPVTLLRATSAQDAGVPITRPATRRYDRLLGDLATVASDSRRGWRRRRRSYGRHVATTSGWSWRSGLSPSGTATSGSAVWTEIPDGYYPAFEQRMRGAAGSIEDRLRGYETSPCHCGGPRSTEESRPRWIDLGCGQGEFCTVLREWGWEAEGVDASPDAVEACRARGIDVTLADVLAYLETRPDDPVGGSARSS